MMRYAKLILGALLLAGGSVESSALSWNNQQDAKLPQSSRRVVMMGNSITEYWLGHDVNNHKEFFIDNGALDRGIAAQQTPAMVNRFQNDVVSLHPLVTVIAGGVNDLNDKSTVDEVFDNTLKMVKMAQDAGIKPILATINPSGWSKERVDKYIAYNKKVSEYCDQTGISFCNYFDAVTMGTPVGDFKYTGEYNEMKYEYRGRTDHSDHLHPGREGYLAMESVLIPLIEANIWHGSYYEAEHAVKYGKSATDRQMASASGESVVRNLGAGNYLAFGFSSPRTCRYYLTVRYTSDSNTTLSIKVGDDVYEVECPVTGGELGEVTVELKLYRGFNRIFVADQEGDAPELDRFSIREQTIKDLYSTFSIIGDSYSTYLGYIDARVEFTGTGCEYPQSKYDLTSVDDTWWKQFEAITGSRLVQNNSISGTTMSYVSLSGTGTTKTVSFVNRVTKMDEAKLFIIEGGTNDFVGGRTSYSNAADKTINGKPIVGDYKWDGFEADMPDYRFVRPSVAYMIWYLQSTYPGCTVVFMANDQIPEVGKESFKTICDHYGAIYYEMHDIVRSVDNPHPMKAGMTSICRQLIETLEEANGILPVSDKFYIYNVGEDKWVKAGASVGASQPMLVDMEERTALTITQGPDGYKIASDENPNIGWGVSGRNMLYDDNDGNPTKWGTTLTPGWEFVDTGDGDNSVYIRYKWGKWTQGGVSGINDPSNKSYALFYGSWALGTYRWSPADQKDVKGTTMIYPDLYENILSHGTSAKWRILPLGDGRLDVLPKDLEPSVVEEVGVDENAPVEYFNLQGVRVANPSKGLYIRRMGNKAEKIIL